MIVDFHSHMVPSGIARVGVEETDWHGIRIKADPDGGLRFHVADHKGRLPWLEKAADRR